MRSEGLTSLIFSQVTGWFYQGLFGGICLSYDYLQSHLYHVLSAHAPGVCDESVRWHLSLSPEQEEGLAQVLGGLLVVGPVTRQLFRDVHLNRVER